VSMQHIEIEITFRFLSYAVRNVNKRHWTNSFPGYVFGAGCFPSPWDTNFFHTHN